MAEKHDSSGGCDPHLRDVGAVTTAQPQAGSTGSGESGRGAAGMTPEDREALEEIRALIDRALNFPIADFEVLVHTH